ncbi:MAG TPA: methyltransferase domain-containing protein [Pyrinomonadaceae bacterium]|nr:methyltransferase domain-containing protein [Pyrinomonadaceae bacterium]
MDYDSTDIPVVYDRGRDHGPEFLQLWMDVVSSSVAKQQIKTILDLGCGTGRFSEALATHFDAEVIGVDPSIKMLDQARKKQRDPRVRYEAGSGEAIPLEDESVDLVFMSMSFHHFEDPIAAARECRRVLRAGATVFLRAGIRDRISSYPYVPFFPASEPILEDCLPTAAFICEVFESAGLSTVSSQLVTQQIAPGLAAYAEKLSAGADSVLAQLTQHDFQEGLAAMRLYAERVSDKPVVEPIDVFVFR